MILLAVDTADEVLSLALESAGRVWSVHRKPRGPHDEALLPAVDALLARAGLELGDVGAFAAAAGPGRFTGIRIGMTFCAVAAARLKVPAAAVSRLEALASGTPGELVCAAIPGRREERTHQLFARGRGLKLLGPPAWTAAAEWPAVRRVLEARGASVVEGRPGAAALLAPARVLLARRRLPPFRPLYLKPAGYERPPRLVR